jgi:hypothetical protein
VLYIVAVVAVAVLNAWLGGLLGSRWAPAVGYISPEERDHWRKYGWN